MISEYFDDMPEFLEAYQDEVIELLETGSVILRLDNKSIILTLKAEEF